MQKRFLWLLLLMVVFICAPIAAMDKTPVDHGAVLGSLVVVREDGRDVLRAAEVLDKYLGKMCGITLARKEWQDNINQESGVVFLGLAACKAGGFTREEMSETGPDGYRIRTRNGNVYIAGGWDKGTLFGAYYFLRKLGARFYSVDHEIIPRIKLVKLPQIDLVRKPFFELRAVWSRYAPLGAHDIGEDLGHMNGVDPVLRKLGTHFSWDHTSQFLVPFYFYGKEHPEYYAKDRTGRMLAGDFQDRQWIKKQPWTLHLCFANPDVQRISRERLDLWLKARPHKRFFNITQMDGYGWCLCPDCCKLDTIPGKVMTDRLLWFVNKLAKPLQKSHPEKLVLTLAYTNKTAPPPQRLEPAANVRVFICPYTPEVLDKAHWFDHKLNQRFMPWYREWCRKAAGRLYVYEYPYVSFEEITFIHAHMFWRMRQYAKDGIRGIYQCGRCTYMHSLFNYVSARLAWDPFLEVRPLVEDFIRTYYGPASQDVQKIYDFLAGNAADPKNTNGRISPEQVDKMFTMYAAAEAASRDQPKYLARLMEDKAFLLYTDLVMHNPVKGTVKDIRVFKQRLSQLMRIVTNPGRRSWHGLAWKQKANPAIIKEFLWNVARLKLTKPTHKTDPLFAQLLADPDSVRISRASGIRGLKFLANGRGWQVPLLLFEGTKGPVRYGWGVPAQTCVVLRTKRFPHNRMCANFDLPLAPGKALLAITGLDDDKSGVTPIRIAINNHEVFRGPNGFAPDKWQTRRFVVSTGVLRKGRNKLLIEDLAEGDNHQAQWFIVSRVRIEPEKPLGPEAAVPLFVAHFDQGLSADHAANEQPRVVGNYRLYDKGRWGCALDAGYSKDAKGELIFMAPESYDPLIGTFEMWIKPNWRSEPDILIRPLCMIWQQKNQRRSGFFLYKTGKRAALSLLVYCEDKMTYVPHADISGWKADQWHHVAFTWDAASKTAQIFLDGILAAKRENVPMSSWPADRMWIGSRKKTEPIQTAGALIDEVRITRAVLWKGRKVGEKVFEPCGYPYPDAKR